MPGHTVAVPVIPAGVAGGAGNKEIISSLLVAVKGEAQLALDVRTNVILSLAVNVFEEKVLLFVPTFAPFSFH
jgi:hypothetical protein